MRTGISITITRSVRPSQFSPLGPKVAERVVALTLTDPPAETTHSTADLMARASGISASAVRRAKDAVAPVDCEADPGGEVTTRPEGGFRRAAILPLRPPSRHYCE
jgi:hypothetical protein